MPNKVKYGLEQVYYAKCTIGTDGSATYSTPVAWGGAVSISFDAEGESSPFRADNKNYWQAQANNGYSGDFESAKLPESFRKDILGELVDSNGVILEVADNATVQPFALLFQFNGDSNNTRYVMYNCTATRPAVASQTTEDTTEPVTETCTITASAIYVPAISHNLVLGHCEATQTTTYNTWYSSVYVPSALQA